MSEPHAAIVLSQLARLDEFIARRQGSRRVYDAALVARSSCAPLAIPADGALQLLQVRAFLPDGIDRTTLKTATARAFDVGLSGEVYDTPLHQQPVFAPATARLPASEAAVRAACACPIYSRDVGRRGGYVVEALQPRSTRRVGRQERIVETITGGCGFIGSHVVDALTAAGPR